MFFRPACLMLMGAALWGGSAPADPGNLSGPALDQKCLASATGLLKTVNRLSAAASKVAPSGGGTSRTVYLEVKNGGKSEVHVYDCTPLADGRVTITTQDTQEKMP